jgi:response regulator RpfG family c-di-GMP phosphodiesterase
MTVHRPVAVDGEQAVSEYRGPLARGLMRAVPSCLPSADPDPRHAQTRTVLVVDDEDGVRLLLVRWLEASGYAVVPVCGADEALRRLEAAPAAVAVCDIRMPGRDGLWLAARIREQFPETAVIIASGVQDVEAALESMRYGVLDYLVKPFGRDRLRDAVQRALEWHDAAWKARRWQEALEGDSAAREARLEAAVRRFAIHDDEEVDAMLVTLAMDEREVHAHGVRVARTARATGTCLGLDRPALDVLHRAALLHDLGKLALPEVILRKPAPLTAEEHQVIRRFPTVGADIVGQVRFLAPAAPLIRDARERMDGQGYPRGVPASVVSPGARIIGIADAFDTMTHPRPFRDAVPAADAMRELERCAGSQFDPAVLSAFRRAVGGF